MQHRPYVMGFECDELREMPDQRGKGRYIEEFEPTRCACLTLKLNSTHLE